MAVEIQELRAVVRAEIDDALKGLKKVHDASEVMETGFTRASAAMKTAGVAIGATMAGIGIAVGAAAVAFNKLLDVSMGWAEAAEQQQDANRKLQAVLTATGNAVGVTVAQVNEFASSRQFVTDFADETTVAGAAILATFKHVREDAFFRTLTAAQDISALFGGDLQASVLQLGKALENPATGLVALRRSGVSFTDEQIELVKTLVKSGQLWEAQNVILTEVESQFSGVAEATSHASARLANTWGEIEEGLGGIVLPLFNGLASAAAEAIMPLAQNGEQFEAIGKAVQNWIIANHDGLVSFFKEAVSSATEMGRALMELTKASAPFLSIMKELAGPLIWDPLIAWLQVVSDQLRTLTQMMTGLGGVAQSLGIGMFGGGTAAAPAPAPTTAPAPAATTAPRVPTNAPQVQWTPDFRDPVAQTAPVPVPTQSQPMPVQMSDQATAPELLWNQAKPALVEFGQLLQSLKGKVPKEELDMFAQKGLVLRDALRNGNITMDQFNVTLDNLTRNTNKAADAAEKETKAKQQQALLAGDWKGAGMDFWKTVQSRFNEQAAQFQQGRFNSTVDALVQKLLEANGYIEKTGQAFKGFGEQMQDFGSNVSGMAGDMKGGGEQAQQAFSTLASFLSSREGMISTIQNQISNLQQFLSLENISGKRRMQLAAEIDALFAQLQGLMQEAVPVLDVWRSDPIFSDPGLEGNDRAGGGSRISGPNVTISSIFPPSAGDRRMLMDAVIEELQRRGYRT